MTIACAFLVSEGVVFGADSTTTVTIGPNVVQLLNHAQKIFEVGETGRMAMCTWGSGKVGSVSHRTIAARLGDSIASDTTVDGAADVLVRIIERTTNPAMGMLGYFLGGANRDREPACIQLTFDGGRLVAREPLAVGDARFQGAPQMFHRAFRGFDPDMPALLHTALLGRLAPLLPPGTDFDTLFVDSFLEAAAALTAGGHTDMPIREAIDFLHMYLHVTIKGFKFRFGPPVCGGPIELAFVSTDRQFRWVRHKDFDSAILEQEGGLE